MDLLPGGLILIEQPGVILTRAGELLVIQFWSIQHFTNLFNCKINTNAKRKKG